MKEAFARDFQETLTKMKWPGKDVVLSGRLEIEWTEGVEKLLELQEPYVRTQLLKTKSSVLPCDAAPPSTMYLKIGCRNACLAPRDHIWEEHIRFSLSTRT